jgi:hypothetical protein
MIRSLPIASSSRMPGVHWCAVHTAPVGAENPIPPAQATSRYSWMSPVGAENVIRPSGEGRCISRPVVSHRLTTVAHLVRPRVGSCVCAATTSPLIAKIGLTHSIASIHSSCPQGRMRFSAPTGFRAAGINASSPTAPALARVACARNGPFWAPLCRPLRACRVGGCSPAPHTFDGAAQPPRLEYARGCHGPTGSSGPARAVGTHIQPPMMWWNGFTGLPGPYERIQCHMQ